MTENTTTNTTASGAADLTAEIEYNCLAAWNRSEFGANQHDTVHPMYLTAFKSGYKAALAASPNTTASGAADDSLLLCALDLHHSAIYDNPHEMVDCVRAVADRITALAAPAPPKLFLNGFQLRAALDFIAPDGDDEQLESEVCIQHGPERTHDEGTEAAGMYCWLSDYPEEGSIRLDDEATPEAAPVAPAPQPAPMPCPTDAQIDAVYEQTMGQHLRSQDAPAVRRFGRAMFLCAWNAAAPKAAPAINKVSDIIDAYGMTPGQPERVADIPGLAEALEAAFADGSAQVTGAAPPHQGEYLPPPKPDTHCYDEDTGMDVWSYSASQVHAAIDADRAARGAAQVAPAPVADGAVKALHDAMADCRTNGISIDASVMGFFCNRLNEQPAPVAEDADPLQDAANWLVTSRATTSATELGSRLCIGYNRADRLFNAARAQAAQPEGATP